MDFDMNKLATPYYIMEEAVLIKNLEKIKKLKDATGCKVLLAQKAGSFYPMYDLMKPHLDGTCASGVYEARLAHEHFGKENHMYAPAYKEHELVEALTMCGHVIFNNATQYERFKHLLDGKDVGLRINPEHSTTSNPRYDPCLPTSRLGMTIANFPDELPEGIKGLHFHTLCQQNSDDLEATFKKAESNFAKFFHQVDWINMGGGHMVTWDHYDLDRLIKLINYIKTTYNVQVYIEPGEAIWLDVGYLVASVLDVAGQNVILDASGSCHMPDVVDAPYRAGIVGADLPGVKKHTYRLGGPTCLAGDNLGEYSFDNEMQIGDRIVFTDMAHYTMVKNNTFNGIPLPSIAMCKQNGDVELVKAFGYEDFKVRLG